MAVFGRHRVGQAMVLLALTMLSVALAWVVWVRDSDEPDFAPVTNQGARWRIAYYEGGPFYDYHAHLRALVGGLTRLGWMEPLVLPNSGLSNDTRGFWTYLAEHTDSQYLEFVSDAYWSAGWDDTLRLESRAEAIQRFAVIGDIDLIIAMGTWAGLDLATNDHAVPTIIMSTSNAITADVIQSAEDSGYEHVHAWVDPDQYVRQARLFHDIIGFKKLGVVYENTPDGWTYANLDELTKVAGERKFELILCDAPDSGVSQEQAYRGMYDCLEWLAPQIDAMWLSSGHRGMETASLPGMLAPLFAYHVPSWSSQGAEQVARGALISIARRDLSGLGLWSAKVVARIFHGVKPRDIDQVFELPSAIAINLETARRIGYDPPDGILKAADIVYSTIETRLEQP